MIIDPDFLRFFNEEFRNRLGRANVPGLPHASWDRKAAWLLWVAEKRGAPAASEKPNDTSKQDIFS